MSTPGCTWLHLVGFLVFWFIGFIVFLFFFPHRLAGGLGWQGPPTFIKQKQAQLDYEGV